MSIYSDPPSLSTFDKRALVVCWSITCFCAAITLLRIFGRIRHLTTPDKLAAATIIPLFLRMGCVHFVILYGTNNVQLDGLGLPSQELRNRRIGSGLLLVSRTFYTMLLWSLKIGLFSLFHEIIGQISRRYEVLLIN